MLIARTILVVLLMLTASLNLVSCDKAEQNSISGKYVSEKFPERFRELKSDGTFLVQEGKVGATGTYKVKDKQVTLMVTNGVAIKSNLDGKSMIDSDGERYTKQ